MNDKEIIKLLEILIGNTEAVGDSAVDKKIESNLKTLIDVANWCMDSVSQSASTRHRTECSMREVGERAFSALCEWEEWLKERIRIDRETEPAWRSNCVE